jgi:hypothetical protein
MPPFWGGIALGGETVNPLEHMRELLRIIREIYKNKNREI